MLAGHLGAETELTQVHAIHREVRLDPFRFWY